MEKHYLRKKELVEAIGIAKSTVSDWITEFHMFIPTVKDGALTYYLPEAIEVLLAIKELRDKGNPKSEILAMLSDRGFPVTVKEAEADLERAVSHPNARKNLLEVMQGMTRTMVVIADQKDALESLQQRQNGQDGRMTDLEKQVHILQQQLAQTQAELAATKSELETRHRGWWPFGRKPKM